MEGERIVGQLSEVTRRIGISVIGLAATAGLIAGCSSSGGGHPSNAGNSSTGGGSSSTVSTPAGGGTSSSTSGGGGGGTVSDPFCTGFSNSDLAGLSTANGEASAIKVWDNFAKDAPSAIKSNVQDIDKYLHDAADHNVSALEGEAAKVGSDSEAIGAYFAAHCHS